MLAKKDKICVFSENDRVLFAKIVNGQILWVFFYLSSDINILQITVEQYR